MRTKRFFNSLRIFFCALLMYSCTTGRLPLSFVSVPSFVCCCCSFTLPPSFSSLTNSWRRLTCDSLTTGKEEENLSIAVLPKGAGKDQTKKSVLSECGFDFIVKTRMKFMFNRVGSRLSLPAFPRGPRLLKCSVTVSQFDGFSPVYIFIHVNPLLLHVMWPLYLRQQVAPQILGKQLQVQDGCWSRSLPSLQIYFFSFTFQLSPTLGVGEWSEGEIEILK